MIGQPSFPLSPSADVMRPSATPRSKGVGGDIGVIFFYSFSRWELFFLENQRPLNPVRKKQCPLEFCLLHPGESSIITALKKKVVNDTRAHRILAYRDHPRALVMVHCKILGSLPFSGAMPVS